MLWMEEVKKKLNFIGQYFWNDKGDTVEVISTCEEFYFESSVHSEAHTQIENFIGYDSGQ